MTPLTGVRRAEACVVGAGWTGLLTACFLAERGMDVTLLEQESLPCPAVPTPASLLQPSLYHRITAHHGADALSAHLRRLQAIMARLPGWLQALAPFETVEDYLYARRMDELPLLSAAEKQLTALGLPVESAPDAGGCPFPVERSLMLPGQLLIPAEALRDVLIQRVRLAGGRVFFGSRVLNATAAQVFTADGRVDAATVLLCTGKPLGLHRRLLAMLESRTRLTCLLTGPATLHSLQHPLTAEGLTLLPHPGGLMALWDAGRTGTREEIQRTAFFRRVLRHRLPDWSPGPLRLSQTVRPLDGLPVVGSFRARCGRVMAATGAEDFLSAMLCAQALARLALRQPFQEDLLLRPDRAIPRTALRMGTLRLRKHRAVNALRTSAPRCIHCGCRLRYHPDPKRWGCACCGSVFGMLGRRISGPALADMEISAVQRPVW